MISRILALELGNDKGLRSYKNLKKLFYIYILPNLSALLTASGIGLQRFYDAESIILLLLGYNLLLATSIQYYAQRNVLSKLNSEAMLKFIPEKTPQFIKLRLLLFVTKFQLPLLLFTVVFLSFFIERTYYKLLLLLFIPLMINIQIGAAIWIRYCMNTLKRLTLQILQVITFISFISFVSYIVFFGAGPLLEALASLLSNGEYPSYQMTPSFILPAVLIVAWLAVVLSLTSNRLNLKILLRNRDLSFEINTNKLERMYTGVYGFGLSHLQKILFEKDVKHIMRNSKVMLVMLGLTQMIYFSIMTFFFLTIPEMHDPEASIFMSWFYLAFFMVFIIFNGILIMPNEEYTGLKNDFDVGKSYHIDLSKNQFIDVKSRILQAFVFPNITIIYTVFIVTLLILSEYTVALIYFLNYLQLFVFIRAWGLWVVKSKNQMNSTKELIGYVNFGLILAFFIILGQAFSRPIESLFLFQVLVLFMLVVLYVFHRFINRDFNSSKGAN